MTPAELRARHEAALELEPLAEALADMLVAGLVLLLAADTLRAGLELLAYVEIVD